MALVAQTLLLLHKNFKIDAQRRYIKSQLQYLDNIPKEILQRVFTSDDEFRNYTLATKNYGNESFDVAGLLLYLLKVLKTHIIY